MRNIFTKAFVAFTALLSATPFAFAEGCDGILTQTRSIESTKFVANLASSLYRSECSGSSIKAGWSAEAGVDAVIEMIPVSLKLGGGSTKEKVEHLCRTFSTYESQNFDLVQDAQTSPTAAIIAWESCKKLEREGVFYTVEIVEDVISLSVRRGTEVVNFLGADYEQSSFLCKGPFGENGNTTDINLNTRFELRDDDPYPFNCRRVLIKNPDGTQYFPAGVVSIMTQGRESLTIPVERLDVLGSSPLSKLIDDVERLQNQVGDLEEEMAGARLSALINDDGTINVGGVCFRPIVLKRCYDGSNIDKDEVTWFEGEGRCVENSPYGVLRKTVLAQCN